jgi:hypothetical protein
MKRHFIAALVTIILAGCGGSSPSDNPDVLPSLPTIENIDALAMVGGGIRSPTTEMPILVLLLATLEVTPEELFTHTKYFGSSSGSSWLNSILMSYPQIGGGQGFPLDEIKDMDFDTWKDFYPTYWTDSIRAVTPKPALEFVAFELDNIVANSWLNALSKYMMLPFANDLANIAVKDAQFGKDENKVVGMSIGLGFDPLFRTESNNFDEQVLCEWSNTLPTVRKKGCLGFENGTAMNAIYGYGNPQLRPIPALNTAGTVIYKQFQNGDIDNPDRITGTRAVPNLDASSIGDNSIMLVAAASSAAMGSSNSAAIQSCLAFDPLLTPAERMQIINRELVMQSLIYEADTGVIRPNSLGTIPPLPFQPLLDNGVFSDKDFDDEKSVPLMLVDGAVHGDNTGIVPILRSIQGYDDPKAKTYEILYLDAPAPGVTDVSMAPFNAAFNLLFSDDKKERAIFPNASTNNYTSWPTDGYAKGRYTAYDKSRWGDLDHVQTEVGISRFEGLETAENVVLGIEAGIKVNITVLSTYTRLGIMMPFGDDPFQILDDVNSKLMAQFESLDNEIGWIRKLFPLQ